MPIANSRVQAYREQWASAVTQTTAASPVSYGPFWPGPYTRVRIGINRTAETGAQTMDAKLQYVNASGAAADFLDHAGNAIAFVQWTDGQTGERIIEVGVGVTSGDADDLITYGTNYRVYNVSLPESFYIVVTGAAGTDDTFSGYIDWLP